MNPVYLIYFALAVVGLLVAWAYVRCFFKRLRCLLAIRRMCRRCGFALNTPPLWFLGSRYSRRCDCVIETPQTIFAVKLFGCLWPLKSLILRERGEYFFRAHSSFLAPILEVFDGYPHTLPDYRFPSGEGKALHRILLVNPMPLEILFQPSNGLESISGTGDMLRDMEIASLSHLIRIAENAG